MMIFLNIEKKKDLNQQKRHILFHWSDWYHRPGGPAEGAECYPADALGQSGS